MRDMLQNSKKTTQYYPITPRPPASQRETQATRPGAPASQACFSLVQI